MMLDADLYTRAVQKAAHPESSHAEDIRQAAVAFLLNFDGDSPDLLAILKAPHPSYPWGNQVALPGGHVDPEDADESDAAMRELEEELAIPVDDVDLIGPMGHFMTIRNVSIAVVAGIWKGTTPITFDAGEIAEVLRIPVPELLDVHRKRGFSGRVPSIDELLYPVGKLTIWGATARIVHHFLEILVHQPELARA